MAISQRALSLEEFLALPEEEPALEYFDGMVTQKVSPKGPHGGVQLELGAIFREIARPRRLGAAFTETRVTFGGQSAVPDVIYYRWDRIQRGPDGRVVEDFTVPPDLAAEITSPGQSLGELEARCRWYVANGVPIALLIHARRETVTVFRPGVEPRRLSGDDAIEIDDVLPGFRVTVRQLFDALYFR
jgi:Uma2 family endonuclease